MRLREGSGGVNLTGVATLTILTNLEFVGSLHKLVCLELARYSPFNHDLDFDLSCDLAWISYLAAAANRGSGQSRQ